MPEKTSLVAAWRQVRGLLVLAAWASVSAGARAAQATTEPAGFSPFPANTVVAFVPADDAQASASLEQHLSNIDVAVPDWFELSGSGCEIKERADEATRRVLGGSELTVLPRLTVRKAPEGQVAAARFPRNHVARTCLVSRLVERLTELHAGGLDVDLQGALLAERREPRDALEFLAALHVALHAHSMRLAVDLSLSTKMIDGASLGGVADAVLLLASDEPDGRSNGPPVGALPFEKALKNDLDGTFRKIPEDRLVIVFESGGHDASVPGTPRSREDVSFSTAMERAAAAGALPAFDEQTDAEHYDYRGRGGSLHRVSFQDALSAWNETAAVHRRGVTRVGVGRLGAEDPSLWSFVGTTPVPPPVALSSVPALTSVRAQEEGEVYSVRELPRAGERRIVVLPDGRVTGSYVSVPVGYDVDAFKGTSKDVALTFDDGPDERNTGHLLDVLRELGVPAAFFVVGDQALKARDLVKREASEGHLIGIHSFTHPHFETLSPREAGEEIEATRELITELVGKRSVLFRAPYVASVHLSRPSELALLELAVQNDCLFVGALVDPEDWQRKSADAIAAKVVSEVVSGVGRVVLLHDGGGDRAQTVAAVRELVPELRRQGYEFVSLDRLLGRRPTDTHTRVTQAP